SSSRAGCWISAPSRSSSSRTGSDRLIPRNSARPGVMRALMCMTAHNNRMGQDMVDESASVTVETLAAIADAFNRHDLDDIMRYFAGDCVLEMPRGAEPWGRRLVGLEQVRQGLASRFEGLQDAHYGGDLHLVCGDFGVYDLMLIGRTP